MRSFVRQGLAALGAPAAMPTTQWLRCWAAIGRSDRDGVAAMSKLVRMNTEGSIGRRELITGRMTGENCTLLMKCGIEGAIKCTDFMLQNGAKSILYEKSERGHTAMDYARFHERDIVEKGKISRPHRDVCIKLKLAMGEFVETDLSAGTPGLTTWPIVKLPYQQPTSPLRPKCPSFKRSKFFCGTTDQAQFALSDSMNPRAEAD